MIHTTVNHEDTSIDLVQHVPSGAVYVARYASVWAGDHCEGASLVALAGPIWHGDIDPNDLTPGWEKVAATILANSDVDLAVDASWASTQTWRHIAVAGETPR